jgi:two-component system, OmpR family, phosphate regulon sensor histidine kinase PhoR
MVATDPPDGVPDENARIFHEAQRSADTIFSHYQLSQLLATHELPGPMAQAVLDELVHVCGAAGGAIWLARSPDATQELVARAGPVAPPTRPPGADGELTVDEGTSTEWVRVDLEDVGVVALVSTPTRPVDAAARRFLALVRHELAIALRSALLRETLERERAELAAVIQGASDAIVLVDADRRVTRMNPAAERMLRRSTASVIGQPCDRALRCELDGTPPRPCGGHCPFERVLRSGERWDGAERVVVAATGETTSVVGSYAVTARGGDGRPQAVGILRNTSELARLAELRRGFLGSVSHELRSPLAIIKGYVETLLTLEPDPASARRYLQRIDETANRLSGMVAQIIDATQLAADQLALQIGPVDLLALVAEAADELRVRHPEVEVSVELPGDVPPLRGDRDRLRQVLDNLLANAAKYGGGAIDVRVGADERSTSIRIEDRGIGVPADERELVFEQFHRARNVRGGTVPGSGLGLTISRHLVEAHGGTIAFDADRQYGSAVVVRLPHAEPSVAIPIGAVEQRR